MTIYLVVLYCTFCTAHVLILYLASLEGRVTRAERQALLRGGYGFWCRYFILRFCICTTMLYQCDGTAHNRSFRF